MPQVIAADTENPILVVGAHEITHRMQELAPEEYRRYRDYAAGVALAEMENLVDQYRDRYAKAGVELSAEEAMDEIAADYTRRMVEQPELFEQMARDDRSLARRILDALLDFLDRIRARFSSRQSRNEASQAAYGADLQTLEEAARLWQRAYDAASRQAAGQTENASQAEGAARYSIVSTEDGLQYVQAEREVLSGDDPKQWERQLENFINNQIRQGEDVLFATTDGHILALTERSAYKLSDRHRSQIAKKARRMLPDEEFALKARAASHIDELIQVGEFMNHSDDRDAVHKNDIGEDGFNYYEAFFRDKGENAPYYRVTFSAAVNENQETMYSIGDIQKRRFPSRNGSSGNAGALSGTEKSSYNPIIYSSNEKSQEKTEMELAFEKAMAEKNKTRFSLKEPVEETRDLIALHNLTENKPLDALEQAGVQTLEYRSGDDADRLEKVNSVEDARFSLRGGDILHESAELRREEQQLQRRFASLQRGKAASAREIPQYRGQPETSGRSLGAEQN